MTNTILPGISKHLYDHISRGQLIIRGVAVPIKIHSSPDERLRALVCLMAKSLCLYMIGNIHNKWSSPRKLTTRSSIQHISYIQMLGKISFCLYHRQFYKHHYI